MRRFSSLVRSTGCFAALLLCAVGPGLAAQPASSKAPLSAPIAQLGKMAPTANLRQLMIGVFFSESNVVFAAQDDLSTIKPDEDAAVSPNPLKSIYNGWEAVQDAALALSDASNLLLLPGRVCSNGQPVPLQRGDWANYVQILREAAAASYRAAQSKSLDAMVQVSGTLSQACDACHAVYRDKYKSGSGKVCLP